jgi:hypothetical protein
MQRFKQLKTDEKVITTSKEIEQYLYSSPFSWLLMCELDGADLEIKNDILYWNSGIIYWGVWEWGVFVNGDFRSGTWLGGILLGGTVSADWHRGVLKAGELKGKRLDK